MQQIIVDQYTIDLEKKHIKNLHLTIYPATGRIRLSAPHHLDDDAIRLYIVSRLSWIKKHFARFEQTERLASRDYVTGEIHYLEGKRYLLNVITGARIHQIKLRGDTHIDLYEKAGTSPLHRHLMIQEWYRARLKVRIEPLIARWQKIIGVQINSWAVKQMKTKWGTCNISSKRIWFNLELARRTDDSLEYIIVHELMHLLQRHHNANFKALMDRFLPDWRARQERLNICLTKDEPDKDLQTT
ncbi:MAG: SprT family zinc-dependent metalloprotease [Candidatus Cloacimonadaceae bacterium]|nr:SprT family zinc-dependent metalloprotease [Candidatus Cloacimonadaceae bacterium]